MSITSNQISTDITLDVSGKSSLSNISANQGNIKSHFVKAKLRDDTQAYIPPSTATGLVSFLTPNNTKVYEDVVADSDMSLRTYLRQCCSGFIKNYRLDKNVKEKWLEDFLEITNDRIVIFVNYNMEIDIIKSWEESI